MARTPFPFEDLITNHTTMALQKIYPTISYDILLDTVISLLQWNNNPRHDADISMPCFKIEQMIGVTSGDTPSQIASKIVSNMKEISYSDVQYTIQMQYKT